MLQPLADIGRNFSHMRVLSSVSGMVKHGAADHG
jgi:hypothetical protein